MKKKTAFLVLTWFLILECLAGCARQGYSCFMEVGSYEISKEEYALLAYDNIAVTAREYGTKDGIDVNVPGFWERKLFNRKEFRFWQRKTESLMISDMIRF